MTHLPRLHIGYDADLDWLMAYELGRVDDGQPPGTFLGVTEQVGWMLDRPGGEPVGFKVLAFSELDADAVEELWGEPLFDAPMLGLQAASAGEIATAAGVHFGGESSLGRRLFVAATRASDQEEALGLWRACLEAGDAMAHFGLGTTLHGLGRHVDAYRHLRHYTRIAQHGAWNWCWFGYAAEALGDLAEARHAYERAIELEEAGGEETDAAERLHRLAEGAA